MYEFLKTLKNYDIKKLPPNSSYVYKTNPLKYPNLKTPIPFKPKLNYLLDLTEFPLTDFYLDEEMNLLITLSESKIITIINYLDPEDAFTIDKYSSRESLVRTIHLNKINHSLIIVYLKTNNDISELKCVELSLLDYKKLVFKEVKIDNMHPPSFLEFDEINSKIITRNSLNTYKIIDFKEYLTLFELNDSRIKEIRTAEDILMTIKLPIETNGTLLDNTLTLDIYDINTGKLYLNYDIELLKNQPIEIIELFNTVVLIKQGGYRAVLYNLIEHKYYFIDNVNENYLFVYSSKQDVIITYDAYGSSIFLYSTKGELIKILTHGIEILMDNLQFSCDRNFFVIYWPEKNRKKEYEMRTPLSKKKNRIFFNSEESIKTPKFSQMYEDIEENLTKNYLKGEFEIFNLSHDIRNSFCIDLEKEGVKLEQGRFIYNYILSYKMNRMFIVTDRGVLFELEF